MKTWDIIGKKYLYFLISGIVIIPGIISLILWGVRPAIDFTGGTLLEFKVQNEKLKIDNDEMKKIIESAGIDIGSMQVTGKQTYLLRLKSLEKDKKLSLQKALTDKYGEIKEENYETVGPTIGKETTENAVKSVLIASLAIIIYIAWAFRQIPKPYSSFKFGVCAVLALIHDVLVIVGMFSLFGHFYKVEVDSLFFTAVLTIMGFSVHDTIVVFDRIRENLKRSNLSFPEVVNESILQTLARSLSTSLTVIFTLVALLLFGGESIHWFVMALLIGIISGTYSSIFNAAPLLVVWEEWGRKK